MATVKQELLPTTSEVERPSSRRAVVGKAASEATQPADRSQGINSEEINEVDADFQRRRRQRLRSEWGLLDDQIDAVRSHGAAASQATGVGATMPPARARGNSVAADGMRPTASAVLPETPAPSSLQQQPERKRQREERSLAPLILPPAPILPPAVAASAAATSVPSAAHGQQLRAGLPSADPCYPPAAVPPAAGGMPRGQAPVQLPMPAAAGQPEAQQRRLKRSNSTNSNGSVGTTELAAQSPAFQVPWALASDFEPSILLAGAAPANRPTGRPPRPALPHALPPPTQPMHATKVHVPYVPSAVPEAADGATGPVSVKRAASGHMAMRSEHAAAAPAAAVPVKAAEAAPPQAAGAAVAAAPAKVAGAAAAAPATAAGAAVAAAPAKAADAAAAAAAAPAKAAGAAAAAAAAAKAAAAAPAKAAGEAATKAPASAAGAAIAASPAKAAGAAAAEAAPPEAAGAAAAQAPAEAAGAAAPAPAEAAGAAAAKAPYEATGAAAVSAAPTLAAAPRAVRQRSSSTSSECGLAASSDAAAAPMDIVPAAAAKPPAPAVASQSDRLLPSDNATGAAMEAASSVVEPPQPAAARRRAPSVSSRDGAAAAAAPLPQEGSSAAAGLPAPALTRQRGSSVGSQGDARRAQKADDSAAVTAKPGIKRTADALRTAMRSDSTDRDVTNGRRSPVPAAAAAAAAVAVAAPAAAAAPAPQSLKRRSPHIAISSSSSSGSSSSAGDSEGDESSSSTESDEPPKPAKGAIPLTKKRAASSAAAGGSARAAVQPPAAKKPRAASPAIDLTSPSPSPSKAAAASASSAAVAATAKLNAAPPAGGGGGSSRQGALVLPLPAPAPAAAAAAGARPPRIAAAAGRVVERYSPMLERLCPSVAGLQVAILKWCLRGRVTKGGEWVPQALGEAPSPRHPESQPPPIVPIRFDSGQDYARVFMQLLMRETLAAARSEMPWPANARAPAAAAAAVVSAHALDARGGASGADGETLHVLVLRLTGRAAERDAVSNGDLVHLRCQRWAARDGDGGGAGRGGNGDQGGGGGSSGGMGGGGGGGGGGSGAGGGGAEGVGCSGGVLGIVQMWDPLMDAVTSAAVRTSQVKGYQKGGGGDARVLRVVVCVPGETAHGAGDGYISLSDLSWLLSHSVTLALQPITGLMTAQREYQALYGITRLPQRTQAALYDPQAGASKRRPGGAPPPEAPLAPPPRVKEGLWGRLKGEYNESQLAAICAVAEGSPTGFTLLQGPPGTGMYGPPGTGKTRTIVGLISVILAGGCQPAPDAPGGSAPVAAARIIAGSSLSSASAAAGLAASTCGGSVRSMSNQGPKVLLCAPSNAAVDELVLRLLQHGIWDEDGAPCAATVVRIGEGGSSSSSAQEPGGAAGGGGGAAAASAQALIASVNLEKLAEQRLKQLGSRGPSAQHKQAVLRNARIIAATLSGSGSQPLVEAALFSSNESGEAEPLRFDAIIIDEAAQAVEPCCLIPLRYCAGTVVLVGDPNQLPATTFSKPAKDAGYDISLFQRLQRGGHAFKLLQQQYRMHPAICAFPTHHFYSAQLFCAPCVTEESHREPFHGMPGLGPYQFYDVQRGAMERSNGRLGLAEITEGGKSFYNLAEVAQVHELLARLSKALPQGSLAGRVGIIAPYRSQIHRLRDARLGAVCGIPESALEISTVDGFQGREKDIIILCCVRAPQPNGSYGNTALGFVSDERRLNVAITRARTSLYIVGHAATLHRGSVHWNQLIADCSRRGCLIVAQPPQRGHNAQPKQQHQHQQYAPHESSWGRGRRKNKNRGGGGGGRW